MESEFYARIVNQAAFDRLSGFLKTGVIQSGGAIDRAKKYIEPTIITNIEMTDKIMQEEVFGPILPIMTFEELSSAFEIIDQFEKPLAIYYYGSEKTAKTVMDKTSSGGACVNDGLLHIVNLNLPFGGVGNSGLGSYRGYEGFRSFSNAKAIVYSPTWLDLPFKYPPFKWFRWIKKII